MQPTRYARSICPIRQSGRLIFALLASAFAILATATTQPLKAERWYELEERRLIGSEREGRASSFVIGEWENWQNDQGARRRSFHLLYFLGAKWYPKYNSAWLLPLWYRQKSHIDERQRTLALPLFYHSYSNDKRYSITTPLGYYRQRYDSIDLFFLPTLTYTHRSENERRLRVAVLAYHQKIEFEHHKSRKTGLFPLFHSHHRASSGIEPSTQQRSSHILPLYYYSDYTTTTQQLQPWYHLWFANYYRWQTEKSEGSLLFPLRYQSRSSDSSYNLILPLAFSSHYALPRYNDGSIYLDTSFAWFYNLISIDTRNRLLHRQEARLRLYERGHDPNANAADLSHKERGEAIFERSDSESYLSWSFLFGQSRYIRADEWRHFRILPLSYLTWNIDNPDHHLTFHLIPGYLRYQSDEIDYRAFFPALVPLYARFRELNDGTELRRTSIYGGPLYISHINHPLNYRERSLFWPIWRDYHSPKLSGERLIWLWSRKSQRDKHYQTSDLWLFWPLLRYQSHQITHCDQQIDRYRLYPLIFHTRRDHNKSPECDYEHGRFSYLFPLFLYNTTTDQKNYLFLNYYQSHHQKGYFRTTLWPLYDYRISHSERHTFWFLPTLSYTRRTPNERYDSHFAHLLWYSRSHKSYNIDSLYILGGALYRHYNRPERRGYRTNGSLWGALWEYERESESGYRRFTLGHGLIFRSVHHPVENRSYGRLLIFIPLWSRKIDSNMP